MVVLEVLEKEEEGDGKGCGKDEEDQEDEKDQEDQDCLEEVITYVTITEIN